MPKSQTSASRAMPGDTSAMIPKMAMKIPRSSTSHHTVFATDLRLASMKLRSSEAAESSYSLVSGKIGNDVPGHLGCRRDHVVTESAVVPHLVSEAIQ